MLQYVPSTQPVVTVPLSSEDGAPRTLPRSMSYPESGAGTGPDGGKRVEGWNEEQINDFVRKLGFLDTQKEGGDKIKHFLHINEVESHANTYLKYERETIILFGISTT